MLRWTCTFSAVLRGIGIPVSIGRIHTAYIGEDYSSISGTWTNMLVINFRNPLWVLEIFSKKPPPIESHVWYISLHLP